MYLRARYYDATTGEFISRDPLGYVDGMSLYRGYFVPRGMDPTGLSYYEDTGVNTPDGKDIYYVPAGNVNAGICYTRVYDGWLNPKWVGFKIVDCPIDRPDGPVLWPDIPLEEIFKVLEELENPSTPPRWPGPSVTDFGTGMIENYLGAIGEMTSQPCQRWFATINSAMQEAAGGNCKQCTKINGGISRLCRDEMSKNFPGLSTAKFLEDFKAGVDQLVETCQSACCEE